MSQIINNLIEHQITNLYGNNFQEFVEYLYTICYGTDFTPIKQKRDQGCDGFLNNRKTVLAIYAPENRDLRKFQQKVGDDFAKYKANLSSTYPNWQLIYNQPFTTSEINFVVTLKSDAEKICPKHIIELVERLKWYDRRRIAQKLGIDDQLLYNDILTIILDDLLQDSTSGEPLSYSQPMYIEEKIRLNYPEEEVELAKDQYADSVFYFGLLQDLLTGYTDHERYELKTKIRRDYSGLSGTFSQRLKYLAERYSEKYKNDDAYVSGVAVVLLYFFEQCLIGKKTEKEKQ